MEEKETKVEGCERCSGRGRFFCSGRHFMVARILIGLLVMISIFLVGVKVGELKGSFGDRFEGGRMMRGGRGYYPGYMMNQGFYGNYSQQQLPPTTIQGTSTVR